MFSFSAQRKSGIQDRVASTLKFASRTMRDSSGFSMPEILAVLTIVAILAAIALAVFASQPARAVDAEAKQLARSAGTAAQTFATDNGGSYTGLTEEKLTGIEPTLRFAESSSAPWVSKASGSEDEYEITIKAPSGDEFEIRRSANGEEIRTCSACRAGGKGSW